MSNVPDFLDAKRTEITARLAELKPLVDEYHRLDAAASALDGLPPSNGNAPEPVRLQSVKAPTKRARKASGKAPAAGTRRGRPKGSGARGAEALALVKENPGIAIPEIAEKMGIKQNYLYRVLPALAEEGLVRKDGRGWHPTEQAAA